MRSGNVDLYARIAARQDFGDDPRITASRDGGSIVPDTVDRTGAGGERDWGVQAGLRYRW